MARIERIYRRCLLVLIVGVLGPIFGLGVLMLDPVLQVGFEPTMAFVGSAVYLAVAIGFERTPRLSTAIASAVLGAASVPTVYGLAVLLGPVSVPVLGLLGLLCLPLLLFRRRAPRHDRPAVSHRPLSLLHVPVHEVAVMLSAVPTPQLFATWRQASTESEHATGLPLAERMRLAEVRGLVLDELERRDPVGFADWLRAGHARLHQPEAFLRHA